MAEQEPNGSEPHDAPHKAGSASEGSASEGSASRSSPSRGSAAEGEQAADDGPAPGIVGPVATLLREVLVPLIVADGGNVHLVDATEQRLALHLTGRFSGCPGNTLAVRRVLEPALRSVAPAMRLEVTFGALVPEGAEQIGPASPGAL